MRRCVDREGGIDFFAWRMLDEDVTVAEFVQLEDVAAFEAELRWSMTDFYPKWVAKGGPNPPPPDPTPSTQPVERSDTPIAVPSDKDIRRIATRARRLARLAQQQGMGPDDDPVAWLEANSHNIK